MKRRDFLRRTAVGGSALIIGETLPECVGGPEIAPTPIHERKSFSLEEIPVADLQRGMASRRFTAALLVRRYLKRIEEVDRRGPRLKAVIELNPDALTIAQALDLERKTKGPRGPLHGIPVLIKDNIDTHDRMTTTAGSLALAGSIAPRDSFVVERLRAAGAVILGKTNLSEWANFRGSRSISGWSGRGGLTRNPYAIDRSPSGSSSGSAVAVSASLCAVAIGTETDGSIVSPSSYCGVVGLKPTVGLVSRSGIIPISASQDTAGPIARTVADAAALLGAMTGVDSRDAATEASAAKLETDYARFLDAQGLRGARIGVARNFFGWHPRVDRVMEAALEAMRREGAVLIDPASLPPRQGLGDAEHQVMLYEFKAGLNAYFASLGAGAPVKSLKELIEFNERNRDRELPFFGQETLVEAEAKGSLTEQDYLDARGKCLKWAREDGIDALMDKHQLDAIVAPTTGPAHTLDLIVGDRGLGGSSSYAAVAGYPSITVPAGNIFGLPVGISFFGRAWSESKLIALSYAFEQATKARMVPQFLPTAAIDA
ncbi:MAG: amidase [Verrucomicrobia bacterium]|nr:MAG: amidase [Verrucomicrobiota bacterium]